MHARRRTLVLVASKLFQVLRGHARAGRAGMVGAETGPKSLAVPLAFLEVELGLEQRTRFKVKFVGERVVKRALEARLIGVVGTLEGRRGTGEKGRTVQDDGGA